MTEPSLTAVFGVNASQDVNSLTISKADLAVMGLTAASDNTAEALLAAILKLAANTLTAEQQLLNAEQHATVQSANSVVYSSAWGQRLRHNLLVSFDDTFSDPGINPDHY